MNSIQDAHEDHQSKKPEPPAIPRSIHQDMTTEGLLKQLARSPNAAICSAEAGAIFGSHSMQSDKSMAHMSRLNELWDGGRIRVGRVTAECHDLDSVRVSMNLAIQPETLQDFNRKQGRVVRGIGFWARFLICEPETRMGTRMFKEPPATWPHLSQMQLRLAELAGLAVAALESRTPRKMLCLSKPAKETWRRDHDDTEKEIGPGGELESVKDIAAKAAENTARLAAVFHVFESGTDGAIKAEHVESAAWIVGWHLLEARRLFGSHDAATELANAERLEGWLLAKCRDSGDSKIARSTVLRYGPARLRKKTCLDDAADELIERHRIREVYEGKTCFYEINPRLLEEAN